MPLRCEVWNWGDPDSVSMIRMNKPRLAALRPQDLEAVYGLVPGLLESVRWHVSTPYALAIGAWTGSELVGILLAVCHASSAHLSDLYVVPTRMNEGIGTALMEHLATTCASDQLATQVVLAEPDQVGWFQHLGFEAHGEFIRYIGGRHVQATMQAVVHAEPQHWLAICHLDRKAMGEDRSIWLREHDFLAYVWQEQGRVRGFLLALAGAGLIIADHPIVGLELQRWMLPVQDHITLPAGQPEAHEHLVQQGYRPVPACVRMVRGTPPPWRPELVFGV